MVAAVATGYSEELSNHGNATAAERGVALRPRLKIGPRDCHLLS